jgi:hypothetical protein
MCRPRAEAHRRARRHRAHGRRCGGLHRCRPRRGRLHRSPDGMLPHARRRFCARQAIYSAPSVTHSQSGRSPARRPLPNRAIAGPRVSSGSFSSIRVRDEHVRLPPITRLRDLDRCWFGCRKLNRREPSNPHPYAKGRDADRRACRDLAAPAVGLVWQCCHPKAGPNQVHQSLPPTGETSSRSAQSALGRLMMGSVGYGRPGAAPANDRQQ